MVARCKKVGTVKYHYMYTKKDPNCITLTIFQDGIIATYVV